jgi:uncharacterized protein
LRRCCAPLLLASVLLSGTLASAQPASPAAPSPAAPSPAAQPALVVSPAAGAQSAAPASAQPAPPSVQASVTPIATQVPVPPLVAHVTDLAGMLSAQQRSALDQVLSDHETRTGNQIAILLLPSTAPEAIEQYSIRVADAWKLGRQGQDDGVLLLVAKDNPQALRRLRIEAGRGVQGVLTDAQSKRVLQDVIAQHFRQNDYYGGLVAGVGVIAALLDQESFAAPEAQANASVGSWWPLLLFGALAFGAMFRSRGVLRGGWSRGASGVLLGSAIGGGLGGGVGRGGGFGGGGFGGGGGGGGFSGGGGGFDGGGASGNW